MQGLYSRQNDMQETKRIGIEKRNGISAGGEVEIDCLLCTALRSTVGQSGDVAQQLAGPEAPRPP
jgi:hypothetical protein